jgi:hypothetical protein
MIRSLRGWLAARKQRKMAKYADEHGWIDPAKLKQLREQQSPLRGMNRQRR